MRKAVIDVGSNSVLLVVAEWDGVTWKQIYETTAVTALGEGTKATGLLGEPGMSASLTALKSMFEKANELGAENILAGATMAARIATNTPDFLRRAEEQGTPVFVLSGEDEAELGFHAVADDPMFATYDRVTIIDPGGHSTELMTADRTNQGWNMLFRRSFPVGTLGLKSQMLGDESPDFRAVLTAAVAIDESIGLCYVKPGAGCTVVLGAAGTNLVSVRDKLATWQPEIVHGSYLTFGEISTAVGAMMPMTNAQRAALVGMERGREKTIHVGALILERFLQAVGAPGCFVSVRGWRHALLANGLPRAS